MRRRTSLFLERAKDSLIVAIELFNRPSERGRQEGVILLLDHAFEMLLKATVFEKTGRVRSPRDKYNYGFEKCLSVCQDQLRVITSDEALILRNLNGFRDAAQHDIVEMSEGLLYGHAQSAVQIFAGLLGRVFKQELADALPRRILPISTLVPTEIQAVISDDIDAALNLLGGRQRREDEAAAKLRPYRIMEENIRDNQGVTERPRSIEHLITRLKKNDWKTVFPMVAGLVQAVPGGIPMSVHATKTEGPAFRIDQTAPTGIAFRYVRPEDKYPFLTTDVADRLGVGRNRVVGLAKLFGLKGKDDFHTSIRVSRTSSVQRYSQRTIEVLKAAIAAEGMGVLWAAVRAGEVRDAGVYRGV